MNMEIFLGAGYRIQSFPRRPETEHDISWGKEWPERTTAAGSTQHTLLSHQLSWRSSSQRHDIPGGPVGGDSGGLFNQPLVTPEDRHKNLMLLWSAWWDDHSSYQCRWWLSQLMLAEKGSSLAYLELKSSGLVAQRSGPLGTLAPAP